MASKAKAITSASPTSLEVLSDEERDVLKFHEERIERNLRGFVETAESLAIIRSQRLYREQYPSFEAYTQAKWNFSRQYASNLITALPVYKSIQVDNPAQGVTLKAFPENIRGAIWEIARKRAGDKSPTTGQLKAIGDVIQTAVVTGGYVDTGNGGMKALEAAVDEADVWRRKRQQEAISENTKWSTIGTFYVTVVDGVAQLPVTDGTYRVVMSVDKSALSAASNEDETADNESETADDSPAID